MTKRSIKKIFILFVPVILLAGCGQMGPLYLPRDDTTTIAKSTEASNATKTSATTAESADTSSNDKTSSTAVDTANHTDKDKQSSQSNTTLSSTNDQTAADNNAEAKQDIQSTESQQDQQSSDNLQNQSE